jgi:hypothetical protein
LSALSQGALHKPTTLEDRHRLPLCDKHSLRSRRRVWIDKGSAYVAIY